MDGFPKVDSKAGLKQQIPNQYQLIRDDIEFFHFYILGGIEFVETFTQKVQHFDTSFSQKKADADNFYQNQCKFENFSTPLSEKLGETFPKFFCTKGKNNLLTEYLHTIATLDT